MRVLLMVSMAWKSMTGGMTAEAAQTCSTHEVRYIRGRACSPALTIVMVDMLAMICIVLTWK